MQNFKKTESPEKLVFVSKLETVPGGGTVAVKDLGGDRVYAGAPLHKDSNGLYHVIKVAKVAENAGSTATEIKIAKGSHLKAGDYLGVAGSSVKQISAIDREGSTSYDTVTLAATLGALTAGDLLEGVQSSNAGYSVDGYLGETFDILKGDNHLQSIVVRGTITESVLAMPVTSRIKSATPLVRFV